MGAHTKLPRTGRSCYRAGMERPPAIDPGGYTVERYFGLVAAGEIGADDRVELLDGVIVAEPPQDPDHASGTSRVSHALVHAVGSRAVVRVQQPLVLGPFSAPEPDVAVVPGTLADYDRAHPTAALLVVEVSRTSLPVDRLSKSRVYAAANIPEYWILNLRDDWIEVMGAPDAAARRYGERRIVRRGDRITLRAFPDVSVPVNEILPGQS
jgi:Uma2 family endonuclease